MSPPLTLDVAQDVTVVAEDEVGVEGVMVAVAAVAEAEEVMGKEEGTGAEVMHRTRTPDDGLVLMIGTI